MNQELSKIKSFTDLITWQEGHKLALNVYKITRDFPREEQFGLTNQLRRAAVSFTSNIAEGFSRNSFKEKSQFYSMALGSLTEIQNQLLLARDIGYINNETFDDVAKIAILVSKLSNGLIKKSRAKTLNS